MLLFKKKEKEEEVGNLPEKEFRIMVIKMIQNLKNKMELQINIFNNFSDIEYISCLKSCSLEIIRP